ncbi:hypothetical protein GCM10023189_51920 [Nibrella saemangeumensis]|uniref:Outer membrane protein beta-barrel domain-containing protein n=1 Tax=Nibrella saemangeumensis TaxID=1084526 RepID=A0ABP8NLE4_9BACT
MKKLFILLTILGTQAWAQTKEPSHTWEIEIDPIAYALKGYSVHGIYAPGRWRFDAGVFGIQVPESFHGNKGFSVYTQGIGVKANYLLQGTRGLFTGIGVGYSKDKVRHNQTQASDTGHTLSVGPHIGYRFFLQKKADGTPHGLYIAPWVSVDYHLHTDKVKFQDLTYTNKNWGYFPTVHIGYRF